MSPSFTKRPHPLPSFTLSYFLLPAGKHSRWHRVWSDEVWSHLEGDPLLLYCFDAEKQEVYRIRLGKLEGARSPFVWSQRASGELSSRWAPANAEGTGILGQPIYPMPFISSASVSGPPAPVQSILSIPPMAQFLQARLFCLLHARTAFLRSMAMVMGPTPPGTGVMLEATWEASS